MNDLSVVVKREAKLVGGGWGASTARSEAPLVLAAGSLREGSRRPPAAQGRGERRRREHARAPRALLESKRLARRFVPARSPCRAAPLVGKERAAEMGETMSKRLKFHLGGEAEMEERAFTNPFPDYEAAASAVFAAGAAEETGCTRPPPYYLLKNLIPGKQK